MENLIYILHILICILIIIIVLLQKGKGSEIVSNFSNARQQGFFSIKNKDSFFIKVTSILFIFLIITSIVITRKSLIKDEKFQIIDVQSTDKKNNINNNHVIIPD